MSKQTDLINIPDAITVDGTKVGIGTTPSATYSAFDTIEFNTASIISQNTATGGASPDGNLVLGSNMNYSSGGGPEYKVTGKATQITQIDGNITLGVATSGTANTNITYNTGLEVLNDGYARAKNGLLFGTDTAAANALNDYEEGTWTPVMEGSTTDPSYGGSATGRYTKIGNIVHFSAYVDMNPYNSNGNGNIYFAGLPFTVDGSNAGATRNISLSIWGPTIGSGYSIAGQPVNNSDYLQFALWGDNRNQVVWTYSTASFSSGDAIYMQGHYFTNA